MIVVCSGCSAKFRVADEKVGPRGARLRCSKCQTIFSVQRPVEVPPPDAPPTDGQAEPVAAPTPPPRAGPPPLPRRHTTLDARAVFEVDLEPQRGAAPAPVDPFAPPPHPPAPLDRVDLAADPFAPAPGGAAPPEDPFAPPATAAADLDPFALAAAAPVGLLEDDRSPGAAAPPPPAFSALSGGSGSLSLEELTTPPARRMRPSIDLAPMPMIGASEDPFASTAPLDPGLSELGDGVHATAEPGPGPGTGSWGTAAPPRPDDHVEPPLQLDPFTAAAVAADPLAVDEPRRAAVPLPPEEPTAEQPIALASFGIRDMLVNAMALAALLVLVLAILVVWRGGLAPSDALRPSAILAALAPRPPSGVLSVSGVTSGLYERARGSPLLFVRGTVISRAATPLEGVRVLVEVVRDGAVLARGEVPAGAVPGPEALYGAVDGAALSRALAEAAAPGGARLAPGASAPFLVAFDDDPASLAGASLRVRPAAGDAR
jgi:predicted Zn finger-like uncharacterized protein